MQVYPAGVELASFVIPCQVFAAVLCRESAYGGLGRIVSMQIDLTIVVNQNYIYSVFATNDLRFQHSAHISLYFDSYLSALFDFVVEFLTTHVWSCHTLSRETYYGHLYAYSTKKWIKYGAGYDFTHVDIDSLYIFATGMMKALQHLVPRRHRAAYHLAIRHLRTALPLPAIETIVGYLKVDRLI